MASESETVRADLIDRLQSLVALKRGAPLHAESETEAAWIEEAIAALHTPSAEAKDGWQPIETEPSNMLPRLYLCHQKILHGFIDATGIHMVLHELGWRRMRRKPTHWRPLLALPAAIAQQPKEDDHGPSR